MDSSSLVGDENHYHYQKGDKNRDHPGDNVLLMVDHFDDDQSQHDASHRCLCCNATVTDICLTL